MRIVLATDWWPPRIGGIESQVFDLAQTLVTRGHHVAVLTTMEAASPACGAAVHRIPIPTVGQIALPSRGALSKITRGLDMIRPDVVHAHGMFSSFAIGAVIGGSRIGCATVFTVHSLLRPLPVFVGAAGLFRLFLNRADALTAVSAATASDVHRASGREVAHIPNGLTRRVWSRDTDVPTDDRFRIAAVTRLVSKKRPVELVHALAAAIHRTSKDVVLDLVGDGPLRQILENTAERLAVRDRIVFHGACSREGVQEVLSRASFAILAGRREAFGLSILEARAAGLPVVALRSGGVPELIDHERNGLLASDHEEFRQLVVRMVADDNLRERCARNATSGLEKYDWSRIVVEHEAVYERAIALRQTRGRHVKNRIAATI